MKVKIRRIDVVDDNVKNGDNYDDNVEDRDFGDVEPIRHHNSTRSPLPPSVARSSSFH